MTKIKNSNLPGLAKRSDSNLSRALAVAAGQPAHHFRETMAETSRIKQMLFDSFSRCLYLLQKFNSDTEKLFTIILERDAQKRLSPRRGSFRFTTRSTPSLGSIY